ncbi:MAG: hypothetical protein IIA85_01900 [Nanoarchaeota archaeon]|nr:hypothetical protein [Nanoarchaeota archaeon]
MKIRKRPKYYYRSFAAINILIFLWLLYSAINGLPNEWFLVILMVFVSAYWISKAWKEWKGK